MARIVPSLAVGALVLVLPRTLVHAQDAGSGLPETDRDEASEERRPHGDPLLDGKPDRLGQWQHQERLDGQDAETARENVGESTVDRLFTLLAGALPLSPILFPIGNEVSVEQWLRDCVASPRGWGKALTCYGAGVGLTAGQPAQPGT